VKQGNDTETAQLAYTVMLGLEPMKNSNVFYTLMKQLRFQQELMKRAS